MKSNLSFITRGQHNVVSLGDRSCINCSSSALKDNPLFHLGLYTGIDHLLTFNENYKIETGLYLEERSYSGGNNTLANLIVYPRIKLSVEESINVLSSNVRIAITGGDFWNENINDIIRFYNIDYHALSGKIIVGKFDFGFMTIGDLSQNIGLDLHQLYRFTTRYQFKNHIHVGSISINEILKKPWGHHETGQDINISDYFKHSISTQFSFEAQAELRFISQLDLGKAFACKLNYTKKNFSFCSGIKYYDKNFNDGYSGTLPKYYGLNRTQLYPLKNFYRNFDQWAVFTHLSDGNILVANFVTKYNSDLNKKLGYFMDIDFNFIRDLSYDRSYWYNFYNVGLQVNFVNNFQGIVSLTNKHMNLDSFYQGFSMSKYPFLSLGVKIEVEKLKL